MSYSEHPHQSVMGISRTADFVVAAANSPPIWRHQADLICDGVADEVEINKLSSLLVDADGGGDIFIAPGTYNLAASITLRSNVKFRGSGERTYLNCATSYFDSNPCFRHNGGALDDVLVENMRITGNDTDFSTVTDEDGVCIYILSNSLVERCIFRGLRIERWNMGIYIRTTSVYGLEYLNIHHNHIEHVAFAGIRLRNALYCNINHNTIDGRRTGLGYTVGDGEPGKTAIYLNTGDDEFDDHCVIEGNTIRGFANESINIQGSYNVIHGNTMYLADSSLAAGASSEARSNGTAHGHGGDHNIFSDNNIYGQGQGVGVTLRRDPVNNTVEPAYCVVKGNRIDNVDWGVEVGYNAGGQTVYAEGNLVQGNVITNTDVDGIQVHSALMTRLEGNIIINPGRIGILIQGVASICTVSGGLISGSGTNGHGVQVSGSAEYVTVEGVTIRNTDLYGVYHLSTGDEITVRNCDFIDDQGTPTMNNAFLAAASTGTCSFYGNRIHGISGTPFFQSGQYTESNLYRSGIYAGTDSPENVVTANVGSIYLRNNGAAGTSFYVKESGTGNTGWVAK